MTFRDDLQSDFEEVIDDIEELGTAAVYTPKVGGPTSTFNVIIGDKIMSGDDESNFVDFEDVAVTARSSDVTAVKYRGTVCIDSVDYTVVNDPIKDSTLTNVSVINLRRTIETKI